jgi:hypothetical protein
MDRTSDARRSAGSTAESGGSTQESPPSAQVADPGISVGPADAEVDAWAERVRLRRQAWLNGPSEQEKFEWSRRERARRLTRLAYDAVAGPDLDATAAPDPFDERRRLQQRYVRELRHAAEGIGVKVATMPLRPFRTLADLVVTGREWEEGSLRPARRRWIPLADDDI